MKKILLAMALATISLGTSGCTALAGVQLVTQSAPLAGNTVLDEKAWYAAEALYNVPAQAYLSANKNGLLSPAVKAKVKPILLSAYQVLKAARQAYKVGDAEGFGARVAELRALSNQAKALLP